ncbi:MAG TPA: hypothetical protein VFR70_03095 [Flavobacterium sp.]|nr:hypothetical protein [Flavobacterium sp.]
MTQQELIPLIGLRSTDPVVIAHFEKYQLAKPPKNLTSNNGSKIIYDKEQNMYYGFGFEVINDCFYPPVDVGIKNPDHKFVAYLTEINFLSKEPSAKKPDPKSADFWNLTLPPQAGWEEVSAWYNAPESSNSVFLKKEISDMLVAKANYDKKKQMFASNWIGIIEHSELISHYYLDHNSQYFGHTLHLYAMVVKWLFDNRYLLLSEALYQKGLPADADEVLAWIDQHLKKHLWDSQITAEPHLRSFLFCTIKNMTEKDEHGQPVYFYFLDIILRQAGKLEASKKLHSGQKEEEKELFRSIAFNEQAYEAFYTEMNRQFEYFKTLIELKAKS